MDCGDYGRWCRYCSRLWHGFHAVGVLKAGHGVSVPVESLGEGFGSLTMVGMAPRIIAVMVAAGGLQWDGRAFGVGFYQCCQLLEQGSRFR